MLRRILLTGVTGMMLSGPALAAELDVTIRVLDEAQTERQVVRELRLPPVPAERAQETVKPEVDFAAEARDRGRALGRAQAEQRKAEQARENARERREKHREKQREKHRSTEKPE